jgi:hypothetical protein
VVASRSQAGAGEQERRRGKGREHSGDSGPGGRVIWAHTRAIMTGAITAVKFVRALPAERWRGVDTCTMASR